MDAGGEPAPAPVLGPPRKPGAGRTKRALLAAALALSLPLAAAGQDPAADRIRRQVEAVVAGESIEWRREPIVARLRSMGLEPRLVEFDPPAGGATRRGVNIVADVSTGDGPLLLLGAHYDRVSVGRGAIDNAAGVAAVLELVEAFARRPLANHSVRIALFDLEEAGLVGSRAMAADSAAVPLPEVYLNFDIFAYGDALWLGAAQEDLESPLASAMRTAAAAADLPIRVDWTYPSSDHLSFRGTRTRSFAVSLLELEDIDRMLGGRANGAAGSGPVRILEIIHTPGDTIEHLDPAAVSRGVRAVEEALRAWDAGR